MAGKGGAFLEFSPRFKAHPSITDVEERAGVPVSRREILLKNPTVADSPAETNSSILSLKGCRFSSEELEHTFCTSFSHAGREERRGEENDGSHGGAARRAKRDFVL